MAHETTSLISKLGHWLQHFFNSKPLKPLTPEEIHLEPRYWQEVIEFMERMHELLKLHTVEDPSIQQINERILDYILNEINTKGQIADIEVRYAQLQTLLDRVLAKNLSKIVGLKKYSSNHADFTEAVTHLELRLNERYVSEKALLQKSN